MALSRYCPWQMVVVVVASECPLRLLWPVGLVVVLAPEPAWVLLVSEALWEGPFLPAEEAAGIVELAAVEVPEVEAALHLRLVWEPELVAAVGVAGEVAWVPAVHSSGMVVVVAVLELAVTAAAVLVVVVAGQVAEQAAQPWEPPWVLPVKVAAWVLPWVLPEVLPEVAALEAAGVAAVVADSAFGLMVG